MEDDLLERAHRNRHSLPGEACLQTERDPVTKRKSIRLITVGPGIIPGRYIAVLEGLTLRGVPAHGFSHFEPVFA